MVINQVNFNYFLKLTLILFFLYIDMFDFLIEKSPEVYFIIGLAVITQIVFFGYLYFDLIGQQQQKEKNEKSQSKMMNKKIQ